MIALSEKQWKWVIIGGLIAVLITIGLLWWAYSGDGIKETERKDAVNIGIDMGKNAIQANLIANQEKEVTNAEINANRANANLANSLKRDSNAFSGSQSDADDAYCNHYPFDSSCADWRLRHPERVPKTP